MTSPVPLLIPDAWRVTIEQQYLGRRVTNTLGVMSTSGDTGGYTPDRVAEIVEDAWGDTVLQQQNVGVTLTGVAAYDLSDPSRAGYKGSGRIGGSGGADPSLQSYVTAALAVNVGLETGRRGRRYRGRTGMVGLLENQVAGNEIIGAARASITAAFEAFRARIPVDAVNQGLRLAVISETYGEANEVKNVDVALKLGTRVGRIR